MKKAKHQPPILEVAPATDRETQLRQQLIELQNENARLRQLIQNNEAQNNINWHRIMAKLLQKFIPSNFFDIDTEAKINRVAQVEALLIKLPHSLPHNLVLLPDGLNLTTTINLLLYKSHQESLTDWNILELIRYYVISRYTFVSQDNKHELLAEEQFQLYIVTALYPQALVEQMGENWQTTNQKGVYRLFGIGLIIIVIVAREIPAAPHNIPWNLLSHDPELIRYALAQSPLPEDLEEYFLT